MCVDRAGRVEVLHLVLQVEAMIDVIASQALVPGVSMNPTEMIVENHYHLVMAVLMSHTVVLAHVLVHHHAAVAVVAVTGSVAVGIVMAQTVAQ